MTRNEFALFDVVFALAFLGGVFIGGIIGLTAGLLL